MISIIVPVYNVEAYLARCIDSILKQSYQDFEIILVDDGSKDNSGSICDEYVDKDSRIKVIHQENGGLSVARNVGIENAVGDYLTYIDSDDLVHPDYLKILLELIQKYNANLACCNFKFFYEESELKEEKSDYSEKCMDGITAMEDMLYGRFHGSSACSILMDAAISKQFKFEKGKYHEDDLISFKYYRAASRVAYTDKPMYYYFQRPGSIMHIPFGKSTIDELDAADYIVENCKEMGKSSLNAATVKQFYNYIHVYKSFQDLKTLDINTYKRVKKVLNSIKFNILSNNKLSKRQRFTALLMIFFGVNNFTLSFLK